MVRNPRFHGWRHAQRLMHAGEVVMHGVQRNRVLIDFTGFFFRLISS